MAGNRERETAGGKQDRLQAQRLVDLAVRHHFTQHVDKVTHGTKILDLIWSNSSDILSSIDVSEWPFFTDHKLVTAIVTYKIEREKEIELVYLCDNGRRFNSLNFLNCPWTDIKNELRDID